MSDSEPVMHKATNPGKSETNALLDVAAAMLGVTSAQLNSLRDVQSTVERVARLEIDRLIAGGKLPQAVNRDGAFALLLNLLMDAIPEE